MSGLFWVFRPPHPNISIFSSYCAKVSYVVIGWKFSGQCCDIGSCWKFLGWVSQSSGGDSRGFFDCQSSHIGHVQRVRPAGWPWSRQSTHPAAELPEHRGLNWASALLIPGACDPYISYHSVEQYCILLIFCFLLQPSFFFFLVRFFSFSLLHFPRGANSDFSQENQLFTSPSYLLRLLAIK